MGSVWNPIKASLERSSEGHLVLRPVLVTRVPKVSPKPTPQPNQRGRPDRQNPATRATPNPPQTADPIPANNEAVIPSASPESAAGVEALTESDEVLVEDGVDTPQNLIEVDQTQNLELASASEPMQDVHPLEQASLELTEASEPSPHSHTALESNLDSEHAVDFYENSEESRSERSLDAVNPTSSPTIPQSDNRVHQPTQTAETETPTTINPTLKQAVSSPVQNKNASSQTPAPHSPNSVVVNKIDAPALEAQTQTQEPVQPSSGETGRVQPPLLEKPTENVAINVGSEDVETLVEAQPHNSAEPIQVEQEQASPTAMVVEAEVPMVQSLEPTEAPNGVSDDRSEAEQPFEYSSPQPEPSLQPKSTGSAQVVESAAAQASDLSPTQQAPKPQAPTNVTPNLSTNLESTPAVEFFRPHRVASRPSDNPTVEPVPQSQNQPTQPKLEPQTQEQSPDQALSLYERLKATWPRATDAIPPSQPTPESSISTSESGQKPILELFKRLEKTWPSAQPTKRFVQALEPSQATDLEAEAEAPPPSGPASVWAYTGRLPDFLTFGHNPLETEVSPISQTSREFLQPLMGFDPQLAQVYRGPGSDQLNLAHRADALNLGPAVVLGSWVGPDTPEMLGLLAHELTHLARQQNPYFVPPVLASITPSDFTEEGLAQQVEQTVEQQAQEGSLEGSFGSLPAPWQPLPSWLAAAGARSESGSSTGFGASPSSAQDSGFTSAQSSRLSSFSQLGSAGTGNPVGVQTASQDRSPQEVSPSGPLPERSAETSGSSADTPPNLDALAEEVYTVLKRRLAEERRRR